MKKDELIGLAESVQTGAAERELQKALRIEGILDSRASLGHTTLSARLREIPESQFDAELARRAVANAYSGLNLVYRHANIRVYLAFSASLLCSVATVALGLWTVWHVVSAGQKVDQLKAVSSFATAILGGSCFWLYRRERERLSPIEKELMRFRQFSGAQ